jgi:hypothetical protein
VPAKMLFVSSGRFPLLRRSSRRHQAIAGPSRHVCSHANVVEIESNACAFFGVARLPVLKVLKLSLTYLLPVAVSVALCVFIAGLSLWENLSSQRCTSVFSSQVSPFEFGDQCFALGDLSALGRILLGGISRRVAGS